MIVNLDWAKLPAILWGVEAIYNKIVFAAAFEPIERKLLKIADHIGILNENSILDLRRFHKKSANIKKCKVICEKILTIFKQVSTIVLLIITFAVVLIIFRDVLQAYHSTTWSNLLEFLSFLEHIFTPHSVLTFCIYYIGRLIFTVILVGIPIIWAWFLERDLEKFKSNLSEQFLNDLSPLDPFDDQ